MSFWYKFENFNNFYMITSARNFYLSTFMLVVVVIIVDIGVGKILMEFGYILNPLEINVEDYSAKKIEMKLLDKEQDHNLCNNIIIYLIHTNLKINKIN